MTTLGSIKALKEANASQHRLIKKLTVRNEALEGVVELARQHMFFATEIRVHRSKNKKCKPKKCLVCASLELQDTAIYINLMNALSELEEV